jgi:hypothetical protein
MVIVWEDISHVSFYDQCFNRHKEPPFLRLPQQEQASTPYGADARACEISSTKYMRQLVANIHHMLYQYFANLFLT